MPVGKKTIRSRDVVFRDDSGASSVYQGNTLINSQKGRIRVAGTQLTVSEGHAWPRSRSNRRADIGGDFFTSKSYMDDGRKDSHQPIFSWKYGTLGKGYFETYTGPSYPINPLLKDYWPTAPSQSDSHLIALGAVAIARCKPTNSVSGLAVALGELKREGIPSIVGSQAWRARSKSLREKSRASGSEYLNLQFGWLPLVRDVIDVANAVQQSERIIAQYKKDDGKLVRRRYEFPLIEEFTEPTKLSAKRYPKTATALTAYMYNFQPGDVYVTKKKTVRRYFSGAFTYHLPVRQGALGRLQSDAAFARKLYGLTLDPEVLWSLTPWSWAADWFANVGGILSNVSDAVTDGLVMPYGYMMEHTIETWTYEIRNLTLPARLIPPPLSLTTETKRRVTATPYGFGLTWEGFSPYQLSILAALGISRRGRP